MKKAIITGVTGQDGSYSWGSFKIIDMERGSLTIKVTLNRGSRMRYIKLHGKISTGAAWNIELKEAQGYYLLFLKSDDRIFPDALTSLYLTNEHIVADVVNSTVWLKENIDGDIDIADKKFVVENPHALAVGLSRRKFFLAFLSSFFYNLFVAFWFARPCGSFCRALNI